MGQIDDLTGDNLPGLIRRIRALEFASNQNNMAIGRGGLRVHSGGGITIENGGLSVTGSATISGTLTASGTINMDGTFTATGGVNLNGPTSVAGNFTVTGPTALNGVTTIAGNTTVTGTLTTNGDLTATGSLDINGPATLNNDLTVAAGKRIILGGLTLENTGAGGGTLNFPNGSVSSGSFGLLLTSSVEVELSAPSIQMTGLPTTTGVEPNVYLDGFGNLKRIIP